MFGDNYVTESEKIDYIYKTLRRKNITRNIFLVIKLGILGFIVYFYYNFYQTMSLDDVIKKYVAPQVSKIVQATAEQTLSGTTNINGINPSNIQITPEMIDQIKKARGIR